MSEKFRLDRKICFQNMFYTKCINVIIDSIGPSIILRSIYLGDNCIQNFHLGRYIVEYTVANLVLRRRASGAIKHDFQSYI